jgi:nitrate reductase gamma subunit
MKQEGIAGIILCAMGLAMLLISPNAWWKAAEKWKTKDGSGPSGTYIVLLRVLGVVFIGAGAALALSSL